MPAVVPEPSEVAEVESGDMGIKWRIGWSVRL